MTVSSTTSRVSFAGNGATTAFATTPVIFFDEGDLTVYKVVTATGVATLQTITTDYTVTGGDGLVGTVTAVVAPASTETYVIVRELDLVQAADFVNNDASDAEVAEDAFDKLTLMVQQLDAAIDRSFHLADSDVTGASLELPTPAASKLIGWDSAGTALANYASATIVDTIVPTAFMETLLDDATAAAARTTLDVPSIAQSQNGYGSFLTSVAGTNTVTGTATPTPAYTVGQRFTFVPAVTNTGATTLNVSSVGAGAVRLAGAALIGGELVAGRAVTVYVTAATPVFEIVGVPPMTSITNTLGADVVLNNVSTFFTGPTVAQGTARTWFASGKINVTDTAGAADFQVKLWDGTTVIASAFAQTRAAGVNFPVSLSGIIASPAGNIRISAVDLTSTSGAMSYNVSAQGKDCTLSVIRIA